MGFLDHSTNNIILDAVLTDEGRRALSKNDGSFLIKKFSFSDDEVNYKIIKKYGRAVGKEKIEKNTPVFESLTNQGMSQKHKLITLPDPDVDYLPKLVLSSNPVTLKRNLTTTGNITVNQSFGTVGQNGFDETPDLVDSIFFVEINDNFLSLINRRSEYVDSQGIAKYVLNSSSNSAGSLTFTVSLKGLSDNTFTIFGDSTETIKTFVKITGVSSGFVLNTPITISKA
jgi:hypothetical protein